MFGIIGESSDVFMFCLNHQPVDSVDCCSTWVRLWFSDDSWFKSLGWLLKLRSWSNTYLHFWNSYFLLRKKINTSALLLVKCPFHQGRIFAKSSWGANHLPALPYVFSRWQVSRLCHASVYGGSRLSLGRQGVFLCWSTFANTFAETKIWPIQIIQNATGFIESLVLHLSVQGCRYQRWSDYRKSSDPSA